MLKKELHTVLKPSLFLLMVTLGVSLVIKIVFTKEVSYFEVFFVMFQYSLLGFSMFMGLSMFLPDQKQGAGDYVLSLPYTRMRLLLLKLLPRLAAVAVFYILFLLLYRYGGKDLIMNHIFMLITFFYWMLFLVSLSFSASADGYMKLGGVALLGVFLYLALIYLLPVVVILWKGGSPKTALDDFFFYLDQELYFHRTLWQVILLLFILPYLTSFVLALKKWGPFSKENYNRGFFKLFIPLTVGVFLVSVLLMVSSSGEGKSQYYLTAKSQVLESTEYSTRLMEINGEVKLHLRGAGIRPFYESDRYLYGTRMERNFLSLVCLDLEKYTVETLLESTPGSWYYFLGFRVFEHVIAASQYRGDPWEIGFTFIDTRSKAIKKIKTTGLLPPNYFRPTIFGADRDPVQGKIFWLIHSEWSGKFPIFKLWETGEAENLGILSASWPVYVNHLLITCSGEDIIFSRITGTATEIVRRLPGLRQFSFHLYDSLDRVNLNTGSIKEIYSARWEEGKAKDYFRLDLETFEITPLDGLVKPATATRKDAKEASPDVSKRILNGTITTPAGAVFYFDGHREMPEGETNWKSRFYINKIYRLEKGKSTLSKEFPVPGNKWEGDGFWFSPNGVVIRQGHQMFLYLFPDLKPLEFKKK